MLISTSSAAPDGVRLGHVLQSLLAQTHRDFRLIVWDEGLVAAVERPEVRRLLDLLASSGIRGEYHRVAPPGDGTARMELVRLAAPSPYVCFVDDGMCLLPEALLTLRAAAGIDAEVGFVQGEPLEVHPGGRRGNPARLDGGPAPQGPYRVWFGDVSLLLVRREALRAVDWDIVARCRIEGVASEEAAMCLMIADQFPCFGVPVAVGYRLAPERRRWQPDVLELEPLRSRVSNQTLRLALPHLAEHLA